MIANKKNESKIINNKNYNAIVYIEKKKKAFLKNVLIYVYISKVL